MSYLKIVWNKHFDQDQDSGSSVHSDFLLCLSFGTINPPLKAICELAKAALNIKSKTINNLLDMNLMSFFKRAGLLQTNHLKQDKCRCASF